MEDEDIKAYLLNLGKSAANVATLPSQAIDWTIPQFTSPKGLASMAARNVMHPEEGARKFDEALTQVMGPGLEDTLAGKYTKPTAQELLDNPLLNALQPGNIGMAATYVGPKSRLWKEAEQVGPLVGTKVVDEAGAPLRVFHGTADVFDEYVKGLGNPKDVGWLGEGFYHTTDPSTASSMTLLKGGIAPNVRPEYVNLQNPLISPRR